MPNDLDPKLEQLQYIQVMLGELRNEHNEIKRNFDIEITRLEETNNHLNTQQQQVDNFSHRAFPYNFLVSRII